MSVSDALGCEDNGANRVSKEAYDAVMRAQEAVDNQDWSQALKLQAEAEALLIKSAEHLVTSGETLAAFDLYDMVMTGNVHALPDDRNGVCQSLTKSFPANEDNIFTPIFWSCPDEVLATWVGSADALDKLEPNLVSDLEIDYPMHQGESDLEALARFDVGSSGKVLNLVVESECEAFAAAISSALRSAKFTPASFRGRPILRPGMVRKFIWQPAN